MSTRRQRSKNKDPQRALLHVDHLPVGYSIGRRVGSRAFEIWQGPEYICLLQINTFHTKWAATHNAILDDGDHRFKHPTPREAIESYKNLQPPPGGLS